MSNIIDSIQLSGTVYTISGSGGGGNPTVELTQAEYDALVTAGTVSADTYYIITDAQTPEISAITSAVTSGSTDGEIPTAKAVYDAIPTTTSAVTSGSTAAVESGGVYNQLGGLKLLQITQAAYDALVQSGTVDPSTIYYIVN